MKTHTIGEVAKKFNVTPKTLRYYQKLGILEPSLRSLSGYRQYTEQNIQQLRFIINCKRAGFSLKEIQEILTLIKTHNSQSNQVKEIIEEKLMIIETTIKELTTVKTTLLELNTLCEGSVAITECPILKALIHKSE